MTVGGQEFMHHIGELESAYDQIIGQIVKMIEEANKWIIRVK